MVTRPKRAARCHCFGGEHGGGTQRLCATGRVAPFLYEPAAIKACRANGPALHACTTQCTPACDTPHTAMFRCPLNPVSPYYYYKAIISFHDDLI